MFLRTLISACLFGLSTGATAASAQTIDGADPDLVLEAVRGFGSGHLSTDNTGDPMIEGRIDGVGYAVFFYGCDSGQDCNAVQFAASWVNPGHVTSARINDWNREKRFGKAYLDSDGDPVITMDVNLDYGVTIRNFEDTADWWRIAATGFYEEVISQ